MSAAELDLEVCGGTVVHIAFDDRDLTIGSVLHAEHDLALRGDGAGDILVLARSDARAVNGFEDALARCQDFADEGADILFLEAPENIDEMRRFCASVKRPCMANMVFQGKTPVLPPAELQEIGYRLAVYPIAALAGLIAALRQTYAALVPGSGTAHPPQLDFTALQEAVGFPAYWDAEKKYAVE